MTKPANWHVRPAKTQIIRPVWSESSLSAWWKLGALATHRAHSKDSDQTGRMSRLIIRPVWSEFSLGKQSLGWFNHAAAQMIYKKLTSTILQFR